MIGWQITGFLAAIWFFLAVIGSIGESVAAAVDLGRRLLARRAS